MIEAIREDGLGRFRNMVLCEHVACYECGRGALGAKSYEKFREMVGLKLFWSKSAAPGLRSVRPGPFEMAGFGWHGLGWGDGSEEI